MTNNVENRLTQAVSNLNGAENYGYDAAGLRLWKQGPDGVTHVFYNGLGGKPLADFYLASGSVQGGTPMVYFAGKRVDNQSVEDRLGTAVVQGGTTIRAYYPYGELRGNPATDLQFATYKRDSTTNLDYAQQRYYSSQIARFLTPDPYQTNTGDQGDPEDPQSWNRYTYTQNDPVNGTDPTGLWTCKFDGEEDYQVGCISLWSFKVGRPVPLPKGDGGTKFPKCNPDLSDSIENQLTFIASNYAQARSNAAAIQSQMPTLPDGTKLQVDQGKLIDTFLDWSALESGWGQKGIARTLHNYFGYGSARFSSSTTWGAELTSILSHVPHTEANPNPGNISYGGYLEQTLTSNPQASSATLLQSLANAGYNTNPNYGNDIAGPGSVNDDVQRLKNCMKENGYLR